MKTLRTTLADIVIGTLVLLYTAIAFAAAIALLQGRFIVATPQPYDGILTLTNATLLFLGALGAYGWWCIAVDREKAAFARDCDARMLFESAVKHDWLQRAEDQERMWDYELDEQRFAEAEEDFYGDPANCEGHGHPGPDYLYVGTLSQQQPEDDAYADSLIARAKDQHPY